jgi:hypothetical protein
MAPQAIEIAQNGLANGVPPIRVARGAKENRSGELRIRLDSIDPEQSAHQLPQPAGAYPREAQAMVFDAHKRASGLVGGGLASRTAAPLTSESDGLMITSSDVFRPVSTSTRSP